MADDGRRAEPTGSAGVTGEDEDEVHPRRSALADIAEQTVLHAGRAPSSSADVSVATATTTEPTATPAPESVAEQSADGHDAPLSAEQAIQLRALRRAFMARLGEFRRRRVVVPYGEDGAALTVETHGARWLLAFSDEAALARYAMARGEADRTWQYRMVWGAAVLDAGGPAVAEAGLPCGVLVDAGDGERGLVLPPVVGIVPEAVAVDRPGVEREGAGRLMTGEER